MVLSLLSEAMEEVLNNQPFLYAMMWACCNVILVMFLDFRDGFIWELLNSRNPIPKGIIGLAYRKNLARNALEQASHVVNASLLVLNHVLAFPSRENGNS